MMLLLVAVTPETVGFLDTEHTIHISSPRWVRAHGLERGKQAGQRASPGAEEEDHHDGRRRDNRRVVRGGELDQETHEPRGDGDASNQQVDGAMIQSARAPRMVVLMLLICPPASGMCLKLPRSGLSFAGAACVSSKLPAARVFPMPEWQG